MPTLVPEPLQRGRLVARAGRGEEKVPAVLKEQPYEAAVVGLRKRLKSLRRAIIDGTIVQVHQKAAGAKGGLRLRPSGARAEG